MEHKYWGTLTIVWLVEHSLDLRPRDVSSSCCALFPSPYPCHPTKSLCSCEGTGTAASCQVCPALATHMDFQAHSMQFPAPCHGCSSTLN